jgi:PIN domain nuclease of toxin-antitoxin system
VTQVILDTHAWVWSFTDKGKLSPRALAAIKAADTVYVSPISFFEIGQKVRLGKWPELEPVVSELAAILQEQGGIVAPFTAQISLHASLRNWEHRDPFDRILASSAEILGIRLVSKDPAFSELNAIKTIW